MSGNEISKNIPPLQPEDSAGLNNEKKRREDDLRVQEAQREEDLRVQQAQVEQVRKVGGWYGFFYGLYSLITNFVGHFGHAIGTIASVVPPVHIVIKGFGDILVMIEAAFLSEEKLNRRIIRGANAFIQNTASIATLVLSLNPATAPIGAAVALSAMTVSATKDAFFWYKTSKDLQEAEDQLVVAKEQWKQAKEKFNQNNEYYKELKRCENKIISLERNANRDLAGLAELKSQRDQAEFNYHAALSNDPEVKKQQQIISKLSNEEIPRLRAERIQHRSSFLYGAASIVGASFLTVAAFAAVVAIAANPFTLGLVGLSILAAITVVRVKEMASSKKANKIERVSSMQPRETPIVSEAPKHENKLHQGDELKIRERLHIGTHPVVSRGAANDASLANPKVTPPQAPPPVQALEQKTEQKPVQAPGQKP